VDEEGEEFERTVTGLTEDTAYEFEAVAEWDGGSEETTGGTGTFLTDILGPVISDPWPEDGAEGMGGDVELSVNLEHPHGYTMNVKFINADTGNILEEKSGVEEGKISTEWFGLNYDEKYQWKLEVDDGYTHEETDAWEFTTASQEMISQTESTIKTMEEVVDDVGKQVESVLEGLEGEEAEALETEYEEIRKLLEEAKEARDIGDYGFALSKLEEIEDKTGAFGADIEDYTRDGVGLGWIALIVIIIIVSITLIYYRAVPFIEEGQTDIGTYTYNKKETGLLERVSSSLKRRKDYGGYSYSDSKSDGVKQKLTELKKRFFKREKQKKYSEF